jgi:hypothetical protein
MSDSVIGVRLTPTDKELLSKVATARGEDLSDFVRRAIKKELASLSFLPDYDKKCLGVQVAKHE